MPTCDIYRGGSLFARGVAIRRLIDGLREGNRVAAQRWSLGWPPSLFSPNYGFPFWDYRLELDPTQDIRDSNTRNLNSNDITLGSTPDEVRIGPSILKVRWVEMIRFDNPEWVKKSVYLRWISGPKPDEFPIPNPPRDRLDYVRFGDLNDLSGDQGEPLNADGDFVNDDFLESILGTSELGGSSLG